MHIDNLKFFYEVAQAKSISTVAKQSHISQSALSQQLLKLEDTFNVKLFNRSNKGVSLTKEGQIVYNHCEVILNNYSKMIDEMNNLNLNRNLITIDGVDSITSTLIPIAINKIKKTFPTYVIKVISSDSNSNNILNNISDINISYNNYEDVGSVLSRDLYTDKLVFIANDNFKKDKLTISEFLNTNFVMIDDTIQIKSLLSEQLNSLNEDINNLNILLSVSNFHSALLTIKNNNAITAIPYSIYCNLFENSSFKIIDIEGLDLSLNLYINYNEQFYRREKNFIDKLNLILKNILKS